MMSTNWFPRLALLVLALVFAGGCGSSSNPVGPSNQPEIANNPDNFEFQVSRLSGTTQTLSYSWSNTGRVANVNQSGAVTGGQATISIRDSANVEVYSADLKNTGTFVTSTGASGTWRIDVRLSDVSGNLNFRVQKRQ